MTEVVFAFSLWFSCIIHILLCCQADVRQPCGFIKESHQFLPELEPMLFLPMYRKIPGKVSHSEGQSQFKGCAAGSQSSAATKDVVAKEIMQLLS